MKRWLLGLSLIVSLEGGMFLVLWGGLGSASSAKPMLAGMALLLASIVIAIALAPKRTSNGGYDGNGQRPD